MVLILDLTEVVRQRLFSELGTSFVRPLYPAVGSSTRVNLLCCRDCDLANTQVLKLLKFEMTQLGFDLPFISE
jgi:hypothetical protein